MKIGKLEIKINRQIDQPDVTPDDLQAEQSAPSTVSIRQPWMTDEVATSLSPRRLAGIIRSAKSGDARAFLTLAEEMEERDPHYRSVLSSRKNAISSLEYLVEPGSDDAKAKEIADDVYATIIRNPKFDLLVADLLDALGKGYSVCEIIWATDKSRWWPARYEWRDPRWFAYDRDTGKTLQLLDGADQIPLTQYKYIIHEPHLKSGLQIRSGLALPCAYYHMVKSYDLAGWAAFVQVFGYPLRIGRYGRSASQKDKEILRRALANIGHDVGAMIPENMQIEIINALTTTGNITLYENLAEWVDKQISKAVLGQTMSTDAEGGQYKGDLHNEIRLEIRESDAAQLAATINRDLIIPYVQFNYGEQKEYPHLTIPVPRPENIPGLVDAINKLLPYGFEVKTDDLYYKLGLGKPGEDDGVLSAQKEPTVPALNRKAEPLVSLNAEDVGGNGLETLIDESADEWEPIAAPILERIEDVVQHCTSYEELQSKLPELMRTLDTSVATDKIALALWKARALGDKEALDA